MSKSGAFLLEKQTNIVILIWTIQEICLIFFSDFMDVPQANQKPSRLFPLQSPLFQQKNIVVSSRIVIWMPYRWNTSSTDSRRAFPASDSNRSTWKSEECIGIRAYTHSDYTVKLSNIVFNVHGSTIDGTEALTTVANTLLLRNPPFQTKKIEKCSRIRPYTHTDHAKSLSILF